jgi:hypothetical protein
MVLPQRLKLSINLKNTKRRRKKQAKTNGILFLFALLKMINRDIIG